MALLYLDGSFGKYYTSSEDSSQALNRVQMEINAKYIYSYLINEGWTLNAICGMLGNTQAESTNNPGRWQNDAVGIGPAYGLVQWDPFSKYINWVGNNPNYMDNNLRRIIWEKDNNEQWIATVLYPISFEEFTKSNDTPENLASAWLKNYERAGVEVELIRRNNARSWYEYLGGIIPPTPSINIKNKFKWVLYANKLRNKY